MADDRLEYVSLHTLHTDVATPSLRDVGSDELTPCNLVPAVEGVRPLATMLGV